MTDNTETDQFEPEVPDEPAAVADGGWCAPNEHVFGLLLPETTAKRGGIGFTRTPSFDLRDWTKKQLRREVKRLRRDRENLQKALRKERRRTRRLNRAIDKLLGR